MGINLIEIKKTEWNQSFFVAKHPYINLGKFMQKIKYILCLYIVIDNDLNNKFCILLFF